jgi:hypothetical protein
MHDELWHLYRDLIALRHHEPALHHSSRESTRAHADGDVVTLVRTHARGSVAAYFNLCGIPGSGQLPPDSHWDEVLQIDPVGGTSERVALDPWGFRVFRSQCTPQASEGR